MKWTVPRTAYAGSYSLQVDVYTYDPILQQVGVYLASKSELYLFSVVQDYSYAETYTFAFGAKGIHVHVSQADMNSPVVNGFTTSDYEFWSTILEAAQLAVGQVTPETPITWLNVIGHVMDLNDAYLTGQDFANLVYKTDDGADFLVLQFLQGNTAFFYKGDFVWLKNVYHWPDPGVIIPFNPDTVTVPGYWIWNIDAYTVVVRSGANGQISPGTGTVVFGSTPVYTITPDTGYHIASITVDGGPVLVTSPKGQTYQFSPITYASSISATFAIDTFTITVSYGSGGSITPGTGSVNYGATPTYTITPNSGDHIASITVNGAPVTVTNPKGQTYTFAPVTSAGSVSATFAVDTFVITVSAGVNGQISPGTGSVNYGATPTYSVTPNVGYHIVSITVNGGSVAVTSPKGQSYQFAPVTSAGSIAATFAVDTVGKIAGVVSDLTYTGIAGATVSYVGPVSDSVSTDGSGNYVTPDLSPGSYTVTVSKAWYVSQTKPATVSSGSTTTLNFYLQNAGSFNGRVIDSVTGNGISGADVSYSGSSAGSTSSDADGYYTASNLPTGSYSIIASKTGYTPQTKSATVIIGSSVTVDFQLQPIVNPGSITGRVTDSLTNDGVEGASVAASGPGSGSAITDSNGYYTITSLPSGSSYTVTASKTGYTPQTKTASVTSGSSTTLDFQLQPISPPLFADGFESGGFSAWTGSSNSAGETGAIVGSPTHHGTYSAKFTSNGNGGTESAYCYESVQSSAELFARGYFYLSQSGIVEESDRFFFIILKAGSNGVAYAGWKKTGGLVEWCLVVRSGASYVYAYSADVPSLNRWYCVELHWKEDAVAGSGDLWVDGSLVCSLTGRNTGSYGDANQVGLGLPQISDCASTTIYSDCVVVARANIGPEPPTPISPYVSSHAPEADATNVAVTSNIQVTFSEPMDQTSTQNAFTISPSVSGSFSWSSGDTVMTFTPTSNLAYETLYMVTIASSAQDKEGQNMLSSSSWSFTTGTNGLAQGTFGKIDIGASVSNLCTYSYGSRYQITENGAAQSLSLYVQEATGSGTALKVAIYSDNAGIPVTLLAQGTMTVPANYQGWITVALTSKPVLSAGGYYWLVADAKVSGKTLRFYYSTGTTNQGVYGTTSYASFPANPCQYSARNARAYGIYCTYLTTAPSAPTVVNHVPSSDATGVSTSTSVQVTFSEPMDQTSSQNAFTISPSVSGNFTWTVSDTVMTFTPNASLAQGTLYTISISAAAQSKTPKSLVPCSWSFQTANAGITETFGKTDVGASQTNLCQYFYGSRYQVSKDGVAQSISIRVSEANGEARTVKVAIYSDVGGAPGNLLASGTGTVPAGTDGWVTIALTTAPNLSAGAYYWLVVDATASGKTLRFYYSTGSTNQAIYGTTSLASFPINPCSYAGFKARAYSIYCTYLTNPPSAPSGTSDIPASDATSVSTTTFITVILSEPIDRHTRRRVK
jgi:hypothetical protein